MGTILQTTFSNAFYSLAFHAERVLSLPVSVRPSVRLSVRKLYFVCTITRHRFELESQNLHQACIMGYSRLVLKIGIIEFDLQIHFGHFDSEFWEIRVVRAITRHRFGLESPKFAPYMHPGILSAGIENGGYWPWPSRSIWPFWLRILGKLVCPHDIF